MKVSDDDAYLDIACFETQQALEFLMKAILLENGVSYNKSHDIRYLLSLLEDVNFEFSKKEIIPNKKEQEDVRNKRCAGQKAPGSGDYRAIKKGVSRRGLHAGLQ